MPAPFDRATPFNPGDTFGELALLDVNNERTATVIAKEPTELLRVDRSEFSGLLSRSQLDDLQAKYQYLRQVFSGPAWTDTDLRAAACHTHVRSFRAGQVVFNGGQRDTPYMEHLAVVVEGAAIAIRTLRVSCRPHTGQLRLARGGDSASGHLTLGQGDLRNACVATSVVCSPPSFPNL
jgi:CRP-like cAMP-binding protein